MTAPAPLLIFRRQFGAWLALVLTLIFGGLISYGAVIAAAQMRREAIWPIVGAALIVGLWMVALRSCVKGARWDGPALVLDAEGVTDLWGGKPTIAWSLIAQARLDLGDGDRLVLRLRGNRGLGKAMARLFNGGDYSIYLGSLRVDYPLLQRTADAYIAQATTGTR